MKTKILTILLLAASVAWGNREEYDRDGSKEHLTFVAANNAASLGDTVIGYSSDTVRTGQTIKQCTYLLNSNADTLFVKPTGDIVFTATVAFTWKINVRFYDSTGITGFSQLFQRSTNGGGGYYDCYIGNGHPYSSYKRGLRFNKASGTTNRVDVYNVVLDSMDIRASSETYTTIMDSVNIQNSTLNFSRFITGKNWIVRNNKFIGNTSSGVICSYLTFEDNVVNCGNNGGEWMGSDIGDFPGVDPDLKHIYVRNNRFYNNRHEILCVDGWDTTWITGNSFYSNQYNAIYSHNNKTRDYSVYIIISNNAFYGPSGSYGIIWVAKNPASQSNNLSILRNFFTLPTVSMDSVSNSTVQYSIHTKATNSYTINPASYTSTWTISDTMYGRSKLILTDTVYNFVNRDSSLAKIATGYDSTKYIGPSGYLLFNNDTTIGTNSFTVACSLSGRFWFIDPVNKDSGAVGIRISTDKSTWYDTAKTVKFKAGTVSNVTVSNLAAGTYYYKVYSIADSSKGLHDTIPIDSFTITSIVEVDTPIIEYVVQNYVKLTGGDTVFVAGKKFGNNPSINIGTIISHNDSLLIMQTDAQSVGNINLIVTNGTQKDTAILIYQDPITSDTVYVDMNVPHTYSTYNVATRDSLSGSAKVFNDIHKAIDSTTAGMTVILRGGRYYPNSIRLWTTKNGTAWIPGRYNTLQSYPGEWAIIDGNNEVYKWYSTGIDTQVAVPLIGSASISANPLVKFWKFKRIEITGGGSKFHDFAAGFFADGGPFWFDSCIVHDNNCIDDDANPTGIGGYYWTQCIIEHTLFYSNGASAPNWSNSSDITIFSDYKHYPQYWPETGFNYIATSTICRNVYRENLFLGNSGHQIKHKAAQVFTGRNPAHDKPYVMTYAWLYDEYYHNIFKKSDKSAIYSRSDFMQIHNNVFDSCYGSITTASDENEQYKICFYNNTVRHPVGDGVNFEHGTMYPDSFGQFQLYHYSYNNIIDSGTAGSTGSSIGAHKSSSDALAILDSIILNRNVFTRQLISANDAAATKPIFIGNISLSPAPHLTVSDYQTDYYADAKNWLKTDNVFLGDVGVNRYMLDSNYIINGDTTIANAGVGGSHPYLPGVTLPSYVGAALTSDTWVGDVLALDSLGQSPAEIIDPPVVTVHPVSDTTTSTVRMFAEWTGDSVQVAWYRFHNSDTILMGRDSVLQFTAIPAMHGDSLAAVLYNNADTVMTAKAGIYFVYAVFDSVNTGDSNTIYTHGNFLAGTGWTATLSDSTLTTESGSATNQVFGYNHRITLPTNRYKLVITNGDYTITLWIGRRKSTGNNKPRISIDIGL